jgi:D-amino-acid dehydrogenase
VNARELDAKQVLEHEPLLRPGILGGVLLLDDACFDPLLLVKAITDRGASLGVSTVDASAQRIERVPGGVVVHTSAGPVKAAQVVVAAGVWSPALLKPFGIKVPVRPARGDSVTLPYGPGVPKPGLGMMMVDQKVALSPLSKGLRITGRFGLTSRSDRALNMKRAQTLIRKVGSVLDLDPTTPPNEVWTGLRPATPDGLPLLGRLPGAPEIIASVGHGMLGSTTSIGSAKAVAAVVRGDQAPFDMAAVAPGRFSRR